MLQLVRGQSTPQCIAVPKIDKEQKDTGPSNDIHSWKNNGALNMFHRQCSLFTSFLLFFVPSFSLSHLSSYVIQNHVQT